MVKLQYWTCSEWKDIKYERVYTLHGWSAPDVYTFSPVIGSKVKYSFNNIGKSIIGKQIIHGWIY